MSQQIAEATTTFVNKILALSGLTPNGQPIPGHDSDSEENKEEINKVVLEYLSQQGIIPNFSNNNYGINIERTIQRNNHANTHAILNDPSIDIDIDVDNEYENNLVSEESESEDELEDIDAIEEDMKKDPVFYNLMKDILLDYNRIKILERRIVRNFILIKKNDIDNDNIVDPNETSSTETDVGEDVGEEVEEPVVVKKRRGRPKGSKNKPKVNKN